MDDKTETLARTKVILEHLRPLYPRLLPELSYSSPFELLVATVLSAQCTDAQVNKVTPELFKRCPDAASLASIGNEELEQIVHSTGFFRAKARNLILLARSLLERHGGEVPESMEELTKLAGVGRKTAGVVRSACFGYPAIIVDTHFGRVSRRLGLASSEDPTKLEKETIAFLPEELWTPASYLLNLHGRRVCSSRSPRCASCVIAYLCPSATVSFPALYNS